MDRVTVGMMRLGALLLAAMALAIGPAFAQTARPWAHEASDIAPDPASDGVCRRSGTNSTRATVA